MTADIVRFGRRALLSSLIAGLTALTAYSIHILLLVFARIVLAILLRRRGRLRTTTGLSSKAAARRFTSWWSICSPTSLTDTSLRR